MQHAYVLSAEFKLCRAECSTHSSTRDFSPYIKFINLGRVVRKPISANPGLKVNRKFNFFCIKVFLLFMFCED